MITVEGAEGKGNSKTPLLRISVLGTLDIQWPDRPFPKERMLGRGVAPALGLLKAHLTQPDRFALRDWLLEQFWPRSPLSLAAERLDDVASGLRGLLRPPGCNAKILHFVYGKNGKGNGYRLEGYPQIWVDAEAFEWYVEQAARLDRFGRDSLSLWEQAYKLGSRGEFLPDERYSDWAQPRRARLQGQYRQCVHRVVQLLREIGAYEEALLRLRSYWQEHKADEDALRPLLEMLGERERYQEAEQYYEQAREAARQEQRDLDEKTQDVMECLRVQPIQRERAIEQAVSAMTSVYPGHPIQGKISYQIASPFSPGSYTGYNNKVSVSKLESQQGEKREESVNRRDATKVLGTFALQSFVSHSKSSDFLSSPYFSASLHNLTVITQQFREMHRRGDTFFWPGLRAHITTIQDLLTCTTEDNIRRDLWRLFTQAQLLLRLSCQPNPANRQELAQGKTSNEFAIAYAQQCGDTALKGGAIGHLAQFYLRQEPDLTKATQYVNEAQPFVRGNDELMGWLSLLQASIDAKAGDERQCEKDLAYAIDRAHVLPQFSKYSDVYYTDFSLVSAQAFSLNCWLTLGNPHKAQACFAEMNLAELSENRQASAFYDASRLYAALGDLNLTQTYAFQAIEKAIKTHQLYVISRCRELATTLLERDMHEPHASAILEYAQII